jgi:acetyltransferase-like isoleucine patch superfamily enzyme
MNQIHPSAYVSPNANLGKGIEIGPFCLVHDNVILADGVSIGAYCELGVVGPEGGSSGQPLNIGEGSLIRSHSVFYEGSSFGASLTTGHRVTVREGTRAGVGFQIGTLTEIQGDCTVGDYVRFQSNIFVGKNTEIGSFVWVLPYVILTNDPTPPSGVLVGCVVQDYATLCAGSLILPGVVVGAHAVVAASSCVTKDVDEGILVAGNPARIRGEAKDIILRDGSGRSAYPWTGHFSRGYPDSVVAEWMKSEGE